MTSQSPDESATKNSENVSVTKTISSPGIHSNEERSFSPDTTMGMSTTTIAAFAIAPARLSAVRSRRCSSFRPKMTSAGTSEVSSSTTGMRLGETMEPGIMAPPPR